MHFLGKYIFAISLAFCWSNKACSQIDTLSLVDEIQTYVKFIDSINNLDDVQIIGFSKSIADGVFKSEERVIGGSGLYTLSDYNDDSAFRIMYHDNLCVNIYKTYYYKADQLVYATLELRTADGKHRETYRKEEMYFNGNIILSASQKDERGDKCSYKTNFNLFENGLKYLKEFHESNNRR